MGNPTLTTRIPFPVGEETIRRALVTPIEGGSIHRRQTNLSTSVNTGEQEILGYDLVLRDASATERAEVEALWEQTFAGVLPISWQPPGRPVAAFHFMADSFQETRLSAGRWNIRLRLMEDIGGG